MSLIFEQLYLKNLYIQLTHASSINSFITVHCLVMRYSIPADNNESCKFTELVLCTKNQLLKTTIFHVISLEGKYKHASTIKCTKIYSILNHYPI